MSDKSAIARTVPHDIDFLMARCRLCLTDDEYRARHPEVPCLPQMRRRNRQRIAGVLYAQAEIDRRGADYADLISLYHGTLTVEHFNRRRESRRFSGERAAQAFLRDTPA